MRIYTLAIAFLIGINAEAQVIRAEPFYTAPEEAVATNLLLDSFPGAAVAYSLRKLDKDYTGSAIRVRRSSDNTEQDIGFLSSGYLDTAAMKTFVGNNNGFVVTWYNQADSAGVFGVRNATNSTAASQPQIISSGTILRRNSNVSINAVSDDYLGIINGSSAINLANNFWYYTVAHYGGSGNFRHIGFANSTTVCNHLHYIVYGASPAEYNADLWGGGSIQRITMTAADSSGLFVYEGLSTLKLFRNNVQVGTNKTKTDTSYNIDNVSLFAMFDYCTTGFVGGEGILQEVVIYVSDKSSDRSAIQTNVNSYYLLY